MADAAPEVPVELSGTWWRRIRRAYGLPDLVTDAHAYNFIVLRFAPGPTEWATIMDARPYIRCLLNALIEVAERGDLDDLPAGIETPYKLDEPLSRTWHARVVQHARASGFWPSSAPGMEPNVFDVVKDMLEPISESLRRAPFEDSMGRYFTEGAPASEA